MKVLHVLSQNTLMYRAAQTAMHDGILTPPERAEVGLPQGAHGASSAETLCSETFADGKCDLLNLRY